MLRAERCSDSSRRARACASSRELGELRLALLARAVELGAHVEDGVALDDHAVPELLDVGHQRPVLAAGEVEVLVAAEQVAERFGGEQRLEGVERPALVDVDQPPLEHRAALGQVVLGQDQLGARAVELAREPADLPLDLVHDPLGGLALALEVAELVVDVVHLALEPLLLLLQPVALAADLLEALAAALEVGVLGVERGARATSGKTREGREHASEAKGHAGRPLRSLGLRTSAVPYTCRRCRPTLTRLPPSPSITPNTTMTTIWNGLEEDQAGECAAGPVAEEQVAGVAEHQRQQPAEQPLERALEQERPADEPVGGADQPHDRDLAGPLEQGEPDGDADDHHRHRGEGEPDHQPDDAGDVAQVVELLHPFPPEPDVVDEAEAAEPLGHALHGRGVAICPP